MRGPPERTFYVSHKGRKFGPLSIADLSVRRLTDDMLVWSEGMPQWVAVSQVPELEPYVQHAVAPRTSRPPSRTGRPPSQPTVVGVDPSNANQFVSGTLPPGVPNPVTPRPSSPGRVKFLAITAVVFGALGLLCCPLGIVGSFFQNQEQMPPGSLLSLQALKGYQIVVNIAMLILSIPMLIGGIGLLKARRWGATLIAITSGLCCVAYLASTVFYFYYVQFPSLRWAIEADLETGTLLIAGAIIGILVSLVVIAWHVTNIFLLSSAKLRSCLK